MATLLERRQLNSCRLGYVLVIEGCKFIFTDITDIVGTSWIGASDGREILPGLELPSSIQMGINPREGLLREYPVTFRLTETTDGQNRLALLFRGLHDDSTSYQLARRIAPSTTSLASTLTLIDLSTTIDPAEKHIGTERIDSATNSRGRRSWYIHPGTKPAGFDHPWIKDEASANVPPLVMSDEIQVWAGRQVALHEFVYDEDDDDWATFTEQYNNGSLVWRGTLQGRGRIVDTLQYDLDCFGPASLCRRQLNRMRPAEAYQMLPKIAPTAAQKGIAVIPHRRNAFDPTDTANNTNYQSCVFDDGQDIAATSYDALVSELSTLFSNVVDGTYTPNYTGSGGTDGVYFQENVNPGGSNSVFILNSTGEIGLRFKASSAAVMGRVSICMHHQYWALLGFDPVAQDALAQTSEYYVRFKPFDPSGTDLGFMWADQRDGAATALDFTDYWVAEIQTYNAAVNQNQDADNEGANVYARPLFDGGIVALNPDGKQEVALSVAAGTAYCESQKCFPPGGTYGNAEDRPEINSNKVNSMGWFLLEGQIARGEDQFADVDFEPFAQVARCSWYDASGDGLIGTDSGGLNPVMIVECLEDPRAFGLPYDKITAPWLSGGDTQMTATPMAVFGVRGWSQPVTMPDAAFRLISRTLLSSGTSGAWGTTAIPTFPSTGTNAATTGEVGDVVSSDVEIADLGLNLEADMVDLISFRTLAERTTGKNEPLTLVKHGYVGPIQAEELLGSLLQGRGWCFGYQRTPGDKQPKFTGVDVFGEFTPGDVPTVSGSILTITESDLAGSVDDPRSWMPRVEQTWRAPVDAFDVQTSAHPRDRSMSHEGRYLALDHGSHRRSGSNEWGISDAGLSNPEWYAANTDWNWRPGFIDRWQRQIAGFMAKPNRTVTIRVSAPKGQWLYPGTPFLLTNSRINSLDGQTIGVTKAPCRVIETTMHTKGPYKGSYTITALMLGVPSTYGFGNLWAGSAHVTGWTDNGGGSYTLTCAADWLDMGHGGNDVEAFKEPSWSSTGGTAKVRVYQSFDLETFDSGDTVTADVDSVTAGSNSITISSASGTIYEDTFKIITLAKYSEQAAGNWVRDLVIFHTDTIGTTHSSGTAGKKLS